MPASGDVLDVETRTILTKEMPARSMTVRLWWVRKIIVQVDRDDQRTYQQPSRRKALGKCPSSSPVGAYLRATFGAWLAEQAWRCLLWRWQPTLWAGRATATSSKLQKGSSPSTALRRILRSQR